MKRLALLIVVTAASLFGDGWADLRRACFSATSLLHPNYWTAECVQEVMTTDPLSLTIGTVAPGAGIFAYGLGISHPGHWRRVEFLPGGTFVRSTDGSFLLRDSITIGLPTRGLTGLAKTSFANSSVGYGTYRHALSQQSRTLDAKASLALSVSRMEAKEQYFYGLGNNTARSAASGYSLRLNDAKVAWNNPLFVWASVGINADFLQPRTGLSSDSAIPEMRDQFNNATAPGLTGFTDFASVQPYLQIRVPARRSTYVALDLGYEFYHSIDDGSRYSFRRLSTDARFVRPLIFPAARHQLFAPITDLTKNVTGASRPVGERIVDMICWNQRGGDYCSIGDLSVFAWVDYSFAGANSSIPFYFQSTLGGTDFEGLDTLRGYGDYRFRAPNRMFAQVEYRHPVWGPVGLIVFYDVGKVAMDRSDLAIDHLHHDWGIGLYARIGGREVARVYLGFGTGEGTQIHPKMGSVY